VENERIKSFFADSQRLFIRQVKEWGEILIGLEGKNKYEVLNESGNSSGYIHETGSGLMTFLKRIFLRNHRPITVNVYNQNSEVVLYLWRPFFFFFSDLYIEEPTTGKPIGSVHQKFSFFSKKYSLCDKYGSEFATINSGFFNFFNFEIESLEGRKLGVIKKKWGNLLKEFFTDADTFGVDISPELELEQKALVFSTAIIIDFNHFEDNSKEIGLFD
jgi:uncharacterized protein YxjI